LVEEPVEGLLVAGVEKLQQCCRHLLPPRLEDVIAPGSAIAAAMRCSNATARGTQYPAWLMPYSTICDGSTSERASRKSTTGVITCSQSCRNGTPRSKSIDCWPGPSKIKTL
jgi:hypothetical protein